MFDPIFQEHHLIFFRGSLAATGVVLFFHEVSFLHLPLWKFLYPSSLTTVGLFLREYLKDARAIGSVVPDSRLCVQALLRNVPFASARVILEFGSASGAVTRRIVKYKKEDSVLLCFEKNERFFNALQLTMHGSNTILTGSDVLDAEYVFSSHDIERGTVDCIISTLPCSNLDYDLILKNIVVPWLKPGGLFVQYMHVLSYLKGFSAAPILRKYFRQIESDFVLPNVPPAIVYRCMKDGTTDHDHIVQSAAEGKYRETVLSPATEKLSAQSELPLRSVVRHNRRL